jgi:NAD-dependent dihydropyrimidine dehydrogenase PreA subunit
MTKTTVTWNGIPRSRIKWHPAIDYEKCSGCMSCVRKCRNGVYSEEGGRPKVVKPQNCVVGCTGCQSVCPNGAISHPPKDYLKNLLNGKEFEVKCCLGGAR